MRELIKRLSNHPKLALTIIWLLAILIVQPIGDFPLNDDWYYAYSVKELLKGNWVILDNVMLNLYGQMIWGYLFCSIFGYSYTVLRISVLILSLITLFGIYHLLCENIKNKHWALFGAILFFFNPLFFSLSFTFMTDVPFLAACIWALVYFLRAINSNTSAYFTLIMAGFLSLMAVYVRQMGIFLPLAFLVFCLINKRWNFQAFLPLLITIGGMWLLSRLKGNIHSDQGQVSELFNAISTLEKTKNTLWRTLVRLGAVFLYSGLFFFPLIIFLVKPVSKTVSVMTKKRLSIIGVPLTTFLLISVGKFPKGNIFYNWGLGPKTLKDHYIWKLNDFTEVALVFWIGIKILAFVGSFILILYLINLCFAPVVQN